MDEKSKQIQEFKVGDTVTMNPDPLFPEAVSPDYVERLKSKKNGKVKSVDAKSAGKWQPVISVEWPDIPYDGRLYPWWQLKHVKE